VISRALGAVVLTLLATLPVLGQTRPLRIGVVYDGYQPDNERATLALQKEIAEVMLGDVDLQIPDEKILVGDWTAASVKLLVDSLLKDPDVDMVIGFGVFASQDLAHRGPLPKPAIAPAIIDPVRQSVPSKGTVSGVHNLNYLKFPITIERDVEYFREVIPFKKLTMLAGRRHLLGVPELNLSPEEWSQRLNVPTEIVLVDSTAEPALAAIPADAELLYFHPSLHLPKDEFVKLIQGITQRRLPSISYFGESEVNLGAYASLNPDILPRLIRRIALNVHRIFDGEDPGDLPVDFPAGKRLFLNFNTAVAIGVLPSWSLLLDAELLFLDSLGTNRPRLTVDDAVTRAVERNLDVAAQNLTVRAGGEDVVAARAQLLPHLDLSGKATQIDEDRAVGLTSERSGSVSGTLSQVVFSEPAWANLSIQASVQKSLVSELDQVRLDIALDAVNAYLNQLRARRTLFILLDNLKITRRNLEIARNRDIAGAAEPGEPLRWESEIASNRMDVMSAHSRMMQSSYLLSQTLHQPMEDDFVTVDIELNDPHFLTSIPAFAHALEGPLDFHKLSAYMVKVGVENSPEIKQLDALISAQERSLRSNRLAHFLPTVSAFGERTENFYRGGKNADVGLPYDNTDWVVGLKMSLPVFSGFAMKAAVDQAQYDLRNLRVQREATAEKLELRIRTELQNVKASYFGIHQSRLAAEAAQKNYDIVADSYTEGSVPIVSLLDAQSVLLSANQQSANAFFSYLIDYMNMERAIGQFGLLMTSDQVNSFAKRMSDFVATFEPNR
jgi:outer membrane protein